jgi:hypothetical protein
MRFAVHRSLLAALLLTLFAPEAAAQDVAATCAGIASVLRGTGAGGGLEQQSARVRSDVEDFARLANSAQGLLGEISSENAAASRIPTGAPEAKVYQELRAGDRAMSQAYQSGLTWYRGQIQGLQREQRAIDAGVGALHRNADSLHCGAGTVAGPTAGTNAPRSFAGFWTTADGYVIQLVRLASYVVGSVRVQNDPNGVVGLLAGRFDGNALHLMYTAPQGAPLGAFHLSFSQDGNQLLGRWDPPNAGQSPTQIWWQRAGK